jgi:hypothetical protein
MSSTNQFIIRTEDIKPENILELFVATERDRLLISALKSPNPLIIEGSRGTGKSFLLRVCEREQTVSFPTDRILPIYVSFAKSSLLHTSNPQQFQHWMLARICSRILRTLRTSGMLGINSQSLRILAGTNASPPVEPTTLEQIADAFEESFRTPGIAVDDREVPDVEQFRDAIEDICVELRISRINLLFDEAAHIFRPEQQRQFFTLFRDLRSPYLTCNAAVYPGVTAYGTAFETSHDARIESLHRDITDPGYRNQMREIISKQASSEMQRDIERNGENFDALAYAVSGNPRLLLRTLELAPNLKTAEVQTAVKNFYRTTIWAEHSGLAERYGGHSSLIDWGRSFMEETVIPDSIAKNRTWKSEGKAERTCVFWIHRDAPAAAKEALRLLTYTGIINKLDSGVVATRREVGTRYAINVGCLAATEASPIPFITDIRCGLSIKRFTEYGANFKAFTEIAQAIGTSVETDTSATISSQLNKPISVLELSDYQKSALDQIGIKTIGEALSSSEAVFQRAHYIGPKRSRKIMNVVTAAVLEYLSG